MSATAERIRDFLIEAGDWHRSRDELTGSLPLLNNVLDSVGMIGLVELIESEFGVTVRDEDLDPANFATIDTVVAFILRNKCG